jgi:uncharacterized protein YhaN
VKIRSLRIGGFGRLRDRSFEFGPGLNIIYGRNESGKSTLCTAIVASLYGLERRKEQWRPWDGGAFATTLAYQLTDGSEIEVQRDYERDAKGVRVYDRSGNDLAAQIGNGKRLVPGEAHLGVPLDVFTNAACVRQQRIAVDEGRDAGDVVTHLARALDGGPKEDAALGALKRLDAALRTHVGSDRARIKNAPLRALRAEADVQHARLTEARAQLQTLDELRDRIEAARIEHDRLAAAATETEHRIRGLRAGTLRAQLANLREWREQFAEVQAARSTFDDVATFIAEREGAVNDAYYAWDAAEKIALNAVAEAQHAALGNAEVHELAERRVDAGAIDDDAYAAVCSAASDAAEARARAAAAANAAAEARRTASGGSGFLGTFLTIGTLALCVAIGFAIAHVWLWTAAAFVIGLTILVVSAMRGREQGARRRAAEGAQRAADDALAAEHLTASTVAAVLDPLGLTSIDDLARRRERLGDLLARERAAKESAQRAASAQAAAQEAAVRFDALANELVPTVGGGRAERKAAVNQRAARKRERDGIDARLMMLDMQRVTIIGNDDEYALAAELEKLERAGVEPIENPSFSLRRSEEERGEIAEQRRSAERQLAHLEGNLARAETQIADLAALDETYARTQDDIAHLEAFERAVKLAKDTLETRTEEAHQAFARRLEDYAAGTLATITAGRYGEIFVDPTTLQIRVRVPETQAILDLNTLSAGTRDQAYLVVRFAMARMFAEGFETPPLLLDDPFAYWDAARIERCLPIILHGARDGQTLCFTSSEELASVAAAQGAHRIDLGEPAIA